MKAHPSPPPPASAQLFYDCDNDEPTPLPLPPSLSSDDDEDDRYFEDEDEPSWWSALRPLSAGSAAATRPREIEVLLPGEVPVELPPLVPAARTRARTANDQVCATAHVLRVRARLEPDEQHAFDELMAGPAATDIITMIVNRSEDDAVDKLRRRLADEPSAAETSRRSLALQIAAVSTLLSSDQQSQALASLSTLWPEELVALHARLAGLPPAEAAALIRTYLAPRR
jgi:hypothetical protein